MTKKMKIKTLKKRIKKLESIVQPSSLTIVNSSNPNEKVIFQFDNNVYSAVHQITNNEVTSKALDSFTNF